MNVQSDPIQEPPKGQHASPATAQEETDLLEKKRELVKLSKNKVKRRKIIKKVALREKIKNRAMYYQIKIVQGRHAREKNQDRSRIREDQALREEKKQNFVKFLENHSENVRCPICITDIIEPVTTDCGHLFCLQCIEKALINGNKCPLCRLTIAQWQNYGISFDKNAQNLLKKLNNFTRTEQSQNHYKSYYQWKNKRFLSQQDIKDCQKTFVDVWMAEGYWVTGKVHRIYWNEDDQIEEIMVETVKHGQKSLEIYELNSLRLAKPSFYNKRRGNYQFIRFGMGRMGVGLRDVHQVNYDQIFFDRSRNFLANQYFSVRNRLFIENLPIQNGQTNQRQLQNLEQTPSILRVESELLQQPINTPVNLIRDDSDGQSIQQLQQSQSEFFENLLPVSDMPVTYNPEAEVMNFQNLNPRTLPPSYALLQRDDHLIFASEEEEVFYQSESDQQ